MPIRWDKAFFSSKRLTSELKHSILKQYLIKYSIILGSKVSTIYYVDGFAGPGMYGRGEEGSPLLIAKIAKDFNENPRRPFTLKCINVEAEPKFHKDLEKYTRPFQPNPIEVNLPGEFTKHLSEILERVGNNPTFFFIDPWGTKGIAFENLIPIFNRPYTEILITFNIDGISKKAGWFERLSSPDQKIRAKALKLTRNLALALRIKHEDLQTLWETRTDSADFEEKVLNHYLSRLREYFPYLLHLPIYYYRKDRPPAKREICLYLIFGTKRIKGILEMNDVMFSVEEEFFNKTYEQTFFPGFRNQEIQSSAQKLKNEIFNRFKGRRTTRGEIVQTIVPSTRILLSRKYYNKAVYELVTQGKVIPQDNKKRFRDDWPLRFVAK